MSQLIGPPPTGQLIFGTTQFPCPSQILGIEVPDPGTPGIDPHTVREGCGWHEPVWQVMLHGPVHAELQQMPAAQKVDAQSPTAPHGPPVFVLKVAVTSMFFAPTRTVHVGPLTLEHPVQPPKTPIAVADATS
jgi:hypothetical protein